MKALVKKRLTISRWQWRNMQPSIGSSEQGAPCGCTGLPPTKLSSLSSGLDALSPHPQSNSHQPPGLCLAGTLCLGHTFPRNRAGHTQGAYQRLVAENKVELWTGLWARLEAGGPGSSHTPLPLVLGRRPSHTHLPCRPR